MKLDKETVIKQRFWFLLPVFALCILIGWICVLGVRGEMEKNYKAANDKNTQLKAIINEPEIKNTKWIEAMTKEFGTSDAKMGELWYMESDRQSKVQRDPKNKEKFLRTAPFITWPDQTRAQWMKTNQGRDLYDADFGEPLGTIPSDEYRHEYPQQFEGVVNLISDWLDESNPTNITGAIRVAGGSGNHRNFVIPRLLHPYPLDPGKHVLSEEIYLLQEDLAVKREIFLSLAELLDSYSRLKTEWNEVPYVEIKEVAAAPAPAAPGGAPAAGAGAQAAPAGGAGDGVANPAAAPPVKKDGEPEVLQRYRYYNYIWPNLLSTSEVEADAKLKATTVDYKLPVVDAYKGWRLDFAVSTDPQDEKKLVLKTESGNHSSTFTLPVMPLMVWYADLTNDQEVSTPLYLSDAGGVGPSEYWPNGSLKKMSSKKLKDIPLPANFGRITRIARVLPENTLDHQVVFNNEWLVNISLLRRANSPTLTLRGEITNRSGRRLPVATFTAGMTLPNATNLLYEDFKVATDAFNAGERRTFTQEVKNPIQPKSLAMIKQKLNWRSTPIKRIDRLEIGAVAHKHSDRLKTLSLKPYDFKLKDTSAAGSSATPATPAAAPTGGGGDMGDGAGASLGNAGASGAGGGGNTGNSPNQNIPLNRYIEVSPQLRRMPVALVMVVDATAITDIIAAMSNSRLRFQVTMAPWTKVPNLGRPGGSGSSTPAAGGGGGGRPAGGGGKSGGGGVGLSGGAGGGGGGDSIGATGGGGAAGSLGAAGGGPPGGAGGAPGGAPAGAGNAPSTGGSMGLEDDSSVVELQIYGLITVYESPDNFKRLEKLRANAGAAGGTPAGTTPK